MQVSIEDKKILASNRTLYNSCMSTATHYQSSFMKNLHSQNLSFTHTVPVALDALILSLVPTPCMKIFDTFQLLKVIRVKHLHISSLSVNISL